MSRQFFNSTEWLKNIGQLCPTCNKYLISTQCISICGCYLFCHESCFIKSYCTIQRMDQPFQIQCRYCLNSINFNVVYRYSLRCYGDMLSWILKISVISILLILIALLNYVVQMKYISLDQFYSLSILIVLMIIAFLVLSSLKKQIDYDSTTYDHDKKGSIQKRHTLVLEKGQNTSMNQNPSGQSNIRLITDLSEDIECKKIQKQNRQTNIEEQKL